MSDRGRREPPDPIVTSRFDGRPQDRHPADCHVTVARATRRCSRAQCSGGSMLEQRQGGTARKGGDDIMGPDFGRGIGEAIVAGMVLIGVVSATLGAAIVGLIWWPR